MQKPTKGHKHDTRSEEERPIPIPGPEEVQISIRSVGICGSDLGYWQNGRIGDTVVTRPMLMGHEPSGVVTQVGHKVSHLQVGDRVAVEPNMPCGRCGLCKVGRYNVCSKLTYLATPPTDGCMARFHCHPANFVYKLPDHLSFDEGALVQPLALGFHACERGNVSVGHYVLISGAGPLGMAVVLAAKARGVAKICVTDVIQERLDFIQTIGADVTVLVGKEESRDTSVKVVQALGREADVSIECSGNPNGTGTAIYSTGMAGTVVQVGFGSEIVAIPLVSATLKELDIRGMARFANTYDKVIEAIATGKVKARSLVTHRFPLEKSIEALNTALRKEGVKIIVDCDKTARFD